MNEGGEIKSPNLGQGMDGLRVAYRFNNVVDETRQRNGRADMSNLAATQPVQLRVEQFRDEIVHRVSVEKIDRNEQGRSIGQKISGEMT